MPNNEMKGLCHPTRAAILKRLRQAPARRSDLTGVIDVPSAEIDYHWKSLRNCGCIKMVDTSEADSDDPLFEIA